MEEEKKNTSEEETEKGKGREEEVEEYEEDEEEDLFVEEDEDYNEEANTWESAKEWFQENLRVVLSVIIVVLIAVGIYNYSSKPAEEDQSRIDAMIGEQEVAMEEEAMSTEEINVKEKEDQGNEVVVKEDGKEAEVKVDANNNADSTVKEAPVAEKEVPKAEETAKPEVTQPKEEVKVEKNIEGFHVSAAKGDGLTHLARKAVKQYLAENSDPSITKEHKIYLEDYLRKNVASGRIKEGDVRVFSEQLIADALTKAKNLSPQQLENLKHYSVRVSDL